MNYWENNSFHYSTTVANSTAGPVTSLQRERCRTISQR